MLELVELVLDVDDLVDLLLVLDDGKPRAAMFKSIGQLVGRGVLIEWYWHSTYRLNGNYRPIKIWPVTSDNGDKVTLVHAEIQKPKRQCFDFLLGFSPGPALPDPEFLFPIGYFVTQKTRIAMQ